MIVGVEGSGDRTGYSGGQYGPTARRSTVSPRLSR